MEFNFKKALPLAGVLCGLLSTSFAAQGDSGSGVARPAGQIDDQPMMREITPSAGPRVANGADVAVMAEFILWTARSEGLPYSWSGLGDSIVNVAPGSVQYPDFKFEPGFKVGLGLNLDHDGWDLTAEYTWFRSKRKDAKQTNATLAPTWNINNNFADYMSSAEFSQFSILNSSTSWKLDYNVIDLELGRNYFISQYLTLRPFYGFRGAWINQKYQVRYQSPDGVDAQPDEQHQMNNNQDYWGFGMRTGLDTAWHFTKEFSIYGDMDVSLLWSQYKVDRTDTDTYLNSAGDTTGTTVTNVDTNSTFHTVKPVMALEMGLRYELWFSQDDYHFLIQAGWSETLWTNFNQLFRLNQVGSTGDLTFQGLSVKARFDF